MANFEYKSRVDKAPFTPSPNALQTAEPLIKRILATDCSVTENTLKNAPPPGSAPRIFLFEDGKLVRPDEKGMTIHDLIDATMLGKVFVYPKGQKYPSQLQAKADETRFYFNLSEPVTPDIQAKLPKEPALTRQPRWYHRLFKFWGGNRKLCDDYDKSAREHAKWKTDCENLRKNPPASVLEARTIAAQVDAAYTPLRTEKVREGEERALGIENGLAEVNNSLRLFGDPTRSVENIFARRPKPDQEFIKAGFYTEEEFKALTAVDVDLEKSRIGGQSVTDREFSALAMFATFDPDIATQSHIATIGDAKQVFEDFRKEGFSEEEAKSCISGSNSNRTSIDLMNGDSRTAKTYASRVNPAREKAAQALKAYPGDKKQLAEILSRAVEFTGVNLGTMSLTKNGAEGAQGLSQLCGEMLDLAKRDPELEQLAKKSYEAREKAFRERHPELSIKPQKWEDHVKTVHAHNALIAQMKKGFAARKALLEAERDGVQLTPEQKKGYMKDVLKADIVVTQYDYQKSNLTNAKFNPDYAKCAEHGITLRNKYSDLRGAGLRAGNGGSSVPADMPSILLGDVLNRTFQKPQAMLAMGDPEQVAALDREIENLMEKEGIGEKPLADLNRGLEKNGAYAGDNAVDLLQKSNAQPTAQKTVNAPSKNLTHEVAQQQQKI